MQGLDATRVLGTISPVTSSLAPWLPAHSHSQHRQRTAPSRGQGPAIVISESRRSSELGTAPPRVLRGTFLIFHPAVRSPAASLITVLGRGSGAGDSHFSAHPRPVTVWLLLPWGRRTALGWGCACPAQAELPPGLL